jgi:hypothetical protein
MPLVSDDRDPDQIIRDLRDRIEELESGVSDWKAMAMKFRSALEFYANRDNWRRTQSLAGTGNQYSKIEVDCDCDMAAVPGLTARKALNKL